MGVTYDTGALIAGERGERHFWARHRALLLARQVPTVPATVLAQAWRGGPRQALLARLTTGCDIEPLDGDAARRIGQLIGRAGTSDVVDGFVVEGALRRHDLVVTSDSDDLAVIAAAVGQRLELDRP